MKKIIFLIFLVINILPFLKSGEAYAQNYTVETDADGNMYFPLDAGELPADDGTEIQGASMMCVFMSAEVVGEYFGMELNQWDLAADWATATGKDLNTVVRHSTEGGVLVSEIGNFLSNYFNAEPITAWEVFENYQNGNPAMATIPNGAGGWHEIVIVAADIQGSVEWFDPGDGKYHSGEVGDLNYIYSLSPKD